MASFVLMKFMELVMSMYVSVCELLADNYVAVDKNQTKYWLEKAEAHFPYHPSIFKLKQKLTALGDRIDVDTLESIVLGNINQIESH